MINNYNIKRLSAYAFLISASLFILLLLTFFFASPKKELADNYMIYIGIAAAVAGGVYYFLKAPVRKRRKAVTGPFPDEWRGILNEYVRFYTSLNTDEREKFEKQVQIFLAETKVTGVNVEIDDTDRVLAACSAVIPVFHFDDWEYTNVDEILLYPDLFDTRFETGGGRRIAGMVGSGAMNGNMILSKPALHQGFKNARDKKNVGIHEFIHLIDKMDGSVDGVPELLLEHQYSIPWLDMMRLEIEKINEGASSDINPYGGTAPQEFFAVISEYFFERPKLLSRKHPRLYQMLNKIYKTDLKTFLKNAVRKKKEIGRNDPCPCSSGEKYKRCCGAPG